MMRMQISDQPIAPQTYGNCCRAAGYGNRSSDREEEPVAAPYQRVPKRCVSRYTRNVCRAEIRFGQKSQSGLGRDASNDLSLLIESQQISLWLITA